MTLPTEVFGFLSVCEAGDAKLGGYLLVDAMGRPVEFHCTEPVKPNRAQQILYGDCLDEFVCGERIGQALVTHGSLLPLCVVTDCLAAMSLQKIVDVPVGLLTQDAVTAPEFIETDWQTHRLRSCDEADRDRLSEALEKLNARLDLSEPFERIHGAVEELRKAA